MDGNLSCSQALSTRLRAVIKMQKDPVKSSHSGPVDDVYNCDVLPRLCGRHNESEGKGEIELKAVMRC